MKGRQNWGLLVILAVMALSGFLLLREQSPASLLEALGRVHPGWVGLGLGLMLCFVGCEALCSKRILGRLGHRLPYRQCLGYSFAGFYVSSITPSSTGGQPAQIYYMSRDGVPAAHGSLNMLLLAVCYQVVSLGYAVTAFLLLPEVRAGLGTGLGLLLLYGGTVTVLLTAGMLSMMFLPNAARRLTGGLVTLGVRLRLVRREAQVRARLARQMAEYRRGAECLRANLGMLPALLGLTLLQLTCLYAVPYVVYLGFGLREAGLFQVAGAQALVSVAVGLLPLPGAVGAAEGSALRAFSRFFGPGLAAPAVLLARGISFYSFLLLSAGVTLWVHLRARGRTAPKGCGAAPAPRPAAPYGSSRSARNASRKSSSLRSRPRSPARPSM
ncbi:lysylphosphatidylglycerol synthase transmembrane domain-containing protein [uncultured Intestinimonas sp.]|uniref:lysylphosphatidylglycerol synthase transmembrane domain-containing protein n=1 Tax=uncultured Intestinimonas sp. TaxID=1689265 RepID=UPI0025E26FD5|nr:lysylphosphatidylglycerol synthase transmembrane domain-containing protein [uncultured Intestinimonas sp.]